ncbi:MAG TPA: hypothetical protein VFG73_00850 [Rhodanobacteraceae bacterium]|nr:hypothetical protein [Rhodanobacteraceae bacterium]
MASQHHSHTHHSSDKGGKGSKAYRSPQSHGGISHETAEAARREKHPERAGLPDGGLGAPPPQTPERALSPDDAVERYGFTGDDGGYDSVNGVRVPPSPDSPQAAARGSDSRRHRPRDGDLQTGPSRERSPVEDSDRDHPRRGRDGAAHAGRSHGSAAHDGDSRSRQARGPGGRDRDRPATDGGIGGRSGTGDARPHRGLEDVAELDAMDPSAERQSERTIDSGPAYRTGGTQEVRAQRVAERKAAESGRGSSRRDPRGRADPPPGAPVKRS